MTPIVRTALISEYLPDPAPLMCFRVAVREIESWLLADRDNLATFLSVPESEFPPNPETLDDPKRGMIELAKKSRNRAIREDMLPRPGSGRAIGPAYPSRLIEFATRHWKPEVATNRCESLRRCWQRLTELVKKAS